jgi:hypothetical protein
MIKTKKQNYKKILIITGGMPPSIGRVEKMVKYSIYLNKKMWKVYFLVPEGYFHNCQDKSLISKIPSTIKIFETRYFFQNLKSKKAHRHQTSNVKSSLIHKILKNLINNYFSIFLFLDKNILWLPSALYNALKIINKEKIDVMLTNNNPVTPHIIGLLVKKIKRVPWVASFRDPWLENPLCNHKMSIWDSMLEKAVVKNTNKIVYFKGYQMERHYFKNKYPDVPVSNLCYLTKHGGFDPDDFKNIPISTKKYDTLVISHTGTLYKNTIDHFFKALEYFIKDNDSIYFVLNFYGKIDRSYDLLMKSQKFERVVINNKIISHTDVLKCQVNSDVLLLTVGNGGKQQLSLPSKMWEYIGARRYILALAPLKGEAARLIKKQNLGGVADPDDTSGILKQLKLIYNKFRQKSLNPNPSDTFLESCNREKNFQPFIKVLDSVIIN